MSGHASRTEERGRRHLCEGPEQKGCVTELSVTVKVQMKDMQHLRVCLDAAEADPSQLNMVAAAPAAATVLTAEGAEAAAAMESANHNLVNFQLVPKVASCQ